MVPPAKAKRPSPAPAADSGVAITHPDRVVYPDCGVTKREVADYYAAVASRLLPELAGRPLSVLRCPDGVGSCFFQKHDAGALGAHVKSFPLREKSGEVDRYFHIEDAAGLLELVQMNVIEFHPWGARVEAPDRPDRLVFDLDPAPALAWERVIAAAALVRARLRRAGLASFARLSGGKGVHVVVPIAPGPSWDEAKAFCETFAEALAGERPDEFLARAGKAQREGRIFLDWLRNTRGATSVASWSLRARAGAPVAMPLGWNELAKTARPAAYDLAAALRRARALRRDPWAGFDAAARQALPAAGRPARPGRRRV